MSRMLPTTSSPATSSPRLSTPSSMPLFSSAFTRLSQPRTIAKQLEDVAVDSLASNVTFDTLPKIKWENRRFVQEAWLARKGAKGRKSWIRSYGLFLVELNAQDQPIGHVWSCNRCDAKARPQFFSVQATSSAADHLRKCEIPLKHTEIGRTHG